MAQGVEVYGLFSESDAPGVRSRFFDGVYRVPDGRDSPGALCERLLEIRQRHDDAPVIFPTRDIDIMFLHQYRQKLSDCYRLPPTLGQAARLLDKSDVTMIAERERIAVPKTALCSSGCDLEENARSVGLPLVVKPRFAYQWRKKGAWNKVGARKAVLVESMEQLRGEYQRLSAVGEEVLLQEYIPGDDDDFVVCGCCASRQGELLSYFTARKRRQAPAGFGTGCVVEADDVPDIIAPSRQILRAHGYAGLAEIEFKHLRNSNTFYLIEVNPRHWDQHELGRLVGVNLTMSAYADVVGRDPVSRTLFYSGHPNPRWIAERELIFLSMHNIWDELTNRARPTRRRPLLRILTSQLGDCLRILRGPKIFGVLNLRDPIPGVLLLLRLCLEFARMGLKVAWKCIALRR